MSIYPGYIYIIRRFILIAVSLSVYLGHAQVQQLGMDDGLSNNSVKSIFQDHQGYMWFGTSDGLNRYDGYEIRSYRNQLHNPRSLPHNYIYCVTEDLLQQLWIGTGQGVGIYNRNFDTFSRLRFHPHWDVNDTQVLAADAKTIAVDTFNNVYVGTNGWGLFVKNAEQDVADWIPLQAEQQGKDEYYYHVSVLHVDEDNTIWVFINEKGLFQYEPASQKFQLMNDSVSTASALLSDNAGGLLLGNGDGLYVYDIDSQQYVARVDSELRSPSVEQLALDKDNNVWLATKNGVEHLDVRKKQVLGSFWNSHDYNSLSSNAIYTVYIDQEQRKWIGTSKGGVTILDPSKHKFKMDDALWEISKRLPNRFVRSFLETKSGELWIGTEGGGLGIWDQQTNAFKTIKKGQEGLTDNVINSMAVDHNGDIWMATSNGIQRYNAGTGFKRYPCYAENGRENNHIQIVLVDDQQTLWAATFGYGRLYRYNPEKDAFEIFSSEANDINTLISAGRDYLWGGNYHELLKIDKRTGAFKRYEIGKPVRAIYIDGPDHMWIGTEGRGLILFNQSTDSIENTFADKEGLRNNSVLSIEKDDSGHLWLSTFDGLSRFDPETNEFTNFDRSDGLQSNEFSYGASLHLQDGRLAFGGVNGFNLFYPDSISSRNYTPKMAITAIRINNKLLRDSTYRVQLDSEYHIHKITLPYDEAILSLNFVALEFSSPHKIRYRYMLEGLDKEWNMAGTTRAINYNNLREGSYTLLIESTNAEGEWSNQPTELHIKVLPPWYRSWWAYIIYVGVALGLLRLYIQYRHRQTALKYEVELANFTAKKERELNEKRQSFFTNVSHEFRTPLTLIINPIKDLLRESTDSQEKAKLNMVKRNTKRLLSLVDQLLLFRKAENEVENLKMSRLDIVTFTREIFLCFQHQAQQLHIQYTFETDVERAEIVSDNEKLEIILYNLLSNAFKFTPENGHITLHIKCTSTQVILQVSDTGVGIPAEVGNSIFTKFYSDHRKGVTQKPGFGIGMYLSKTFVDMLDGEISYESTVGVGTTFTIALPNNADMLPAHTYLPETDTHLSVIQELIAEDNPLANTDETGEEQVPTLKETEIVQTASLLVVDDDKQLREYLAQLFRDKYILHIAKDGVEALDIVKKHQPEIVISDVMMDRMNGIELCAEIKSNPAYGHIQVILLTSSPSDRHKLEGVEEGADDYISKPFDADLLKARVSALIKNRKNLQQFFYNAITLQSNDLKISSKDKEFIELCIQQVEKHIRNENFNVKMLAEEMSMSYSSLYKRVKAISGKTANELIRDIRLRKAAQLFIDTDMKVNEVANETGFYDVKYFRVQFSKLFDMNPSDYIKKYRKAFQNEFRVKRND